MALTDVLLRVPGLKETPKKPDEDNVKTGADTARRGGRILKPKQKELSELPTISEEILLWLNFLP